ncbi:MAG: hypothetical protein M1829_001095 [Trizodia sp. TS-e1964]|nr:MAG: hypothetical protein M1829_001095 [Trizodia sp. TS-e1964]
MSACELPDIHFLRLPLEIREKIYAIALRADSPIKPHNPYKSSVFYISDIQASNDRKNRTIGHPLAQSAVVEEVKAKPQRVSSMALLSTCKQIYIEANHMYYSHNTFSFSSHQDIRTFLEGITADRHHLIHYIRLNKDFLVDEISQDAIFRHLGQFPNLKRLTILIENRWRPDFEDWAWKMLRN